MIGFCATIEYGLLALARSASSGARLVLGHRSAPTWSSQWLCAGERSLGCYFNVSSACCPEQSSFDIGVSEGARHAFMPGKLAMKMKRIGGARRQLYRHKQPNKATLRSAMAAHGATAANGYEFGSSRALSLGGALEGYNIYGTLWVSGQLAHWLFGRMHPRIRSLLDARRAGVLPRLSSESTRPLCISMHIRRGDSCSLGSRYCPSNFSATYFAAAARLRHHYSINTLFVATDDANAATLCAQGHLGFDCRTARMDRVRFNARESIERRVVRVSTGLLSGSAVAIDTLADVEMLSECDAHVLVLRSAVSRLALSLSVARVAGIPHLSRCSGRGVDSLAR